MLGKADDIGSLPEWINDSFAKETKLNERWQQFWKRPEDRIDPRQRPGAMQALHSTIWTSLFEGYAPGATRLNLDVRHPFIDLRLLEYLLAIPVAPWCVHKEILRRSMKGKLPSDVLNRPKTGLASDPALQLVRRASVRWLDSFEVSPQLRAFVDLNRRRPVADEVTPDSLWASLRVFTLNYWLSNSWPKKFNAQVNKSSGDWDLNLLNCLKMETMHGT
jgi:asparagine synthase (glutamine-hydrolysing)